MADIPDGLPDAVPLGSLCWLLDISKMRVGQLEREGVIEKTARGLYSIGSVRAVIRSMRERGAGPSAWNRARTELAQEKVVIAKLSRREREGELISADEVIAMNTAIASMVRTRLLTVPSKYAARLTMIQKPADAETILRGGIEEALEEISRLEVVPAPPPRRRAG